MTKELFSLSDKTAVITGAAKGIGRSIAMLFAERGADGQTGRDRISCLVFMLGRSSIYYGLELPDRRGVYDAEYLMSGQTDIRKIRRWEVPGLLTRQRLER